MDVRLPDGTIVRNVPADMTKEQFIEIARSKGYDLSPAQQEEISWLDLPGNIPSSAGQFLVDTVSGIANLPEALPLLGKAALGAWSHAGLPGAEDMEQFQHEASMIGNLIKNRYGSGEAAKRTMVTDPVGVLGDIAALATGGGLALKGTQLGSALSKTGALIDPLSLMANTAKVGIASTIPAKLPYELYAKSGNFNPKQTAIGMAQEIPVSEKGMQQLKRKIAESVGAPTTKTTTETIDTGVLDVKGQPVTRDVVKTEIIPGQPNARLKEFQGPLSSAIRRQPALRERIIDVGAGGGLGGLGAALAATGLPISPMMTIPLGAGYIGAKYFAAPKQLSEIAIGAKRMRSRTPIQQYLSTDPTKRITIRQLLTLAGQAEEPY